VRQGHGCPNALPREIGHLLAGKPEKQKPLMNVGFLQKSKINQDLAREHRHGNLMQGKP
jgi:hypothetical protein